MAEGADSVNVEEMRAEESGTPETSNRCLRIAVGDEHLRTLRGSWNLTEEEEA
jgi:hypothetical protein